MDGKPSFWIVLSDVDSDTLNTISFVCDLARQKAYTCSAWYVSENMTESERVKFQSTGVEVVHHVKMNPNGCDQERDFCSFLEEEVKREHPSVILFVSSIFLSSVAPFLAARLHAGITADCTNLFWDGDVLMQSRPTYGGRMLATIETRSRPMMASVRRGVVSGNTVHGRRPVEFLDHVVDSHQTSFHTISLNDSISPVDIRHADIVFAGGAGMKSKENFQLLYRLAEKYGGVVCASRGAVASGYAGYERQVGQSGLTVHPHIYIAFGISGSVQHLCGMIGSKVIIAVNPDKNAPIHEMSDYSLYADAVMVIQEMLEGK